MKAYKLFNIALAASLLFAFSACTEKAPAYEPAAEPTTAQVYFDTVSPTDFNLNTAGGVISVPIHRAKTTGELSVPVSLSADPAFKGPSTVSFASGSADTKYEITYDLADFQEEVVYNLTLTINGETSEYGVSQRELTASIPASWTKFGTGTLEEVAWGETETKKTVYYRDFNDHIRLCKIEKCWGASGDAVPQDYTWYWDTKTNYCYVPMQFMGWTNGDGLGVYESDAANFYIPYQGWEADIPLFSDYYFEWAPAWMEKNGFSVPKYDGNGGFYLADWLYIVDGGVPTGRGYQFGGDQDFWIGDGFVRITDYNDDKHFGASSALYDGIASSMFFSADGQAPAEFEQSMRYDADYDYEEGLTTTYYLTEYFSAEHSLAFTAPVPEDLADGAEISDVDNEQPTGCFVFGNEVYVTVKKGAVVLPEDEEFPEFDFTLKVYAKDAEGNTVYDFGNVSDVFVAYEYGRDGYTLDDIYGGYLEDYLGVWELYSFDYFDQMEYYYDVEISDAGVDEEGVQWVDINNLSGYGNYFNDVVKAQYTNYALYVYGQDLEADYNGDPISLVLFDPDSEKIYSSHSNSVLGGICYDGALAFVNHYNGVNLSGFGWKLNNAGSYMTLISNVYAYGPYEAASAVKRTGHLMLDNAQLGASTTSAHQVAGVKMFKKGTCAATKSVKAKVFSMSPVSSKNLVETSAPAVSR